MLLRRDRALVAILIMLDVAFHAGRTGTVNAGDIAERVGLARRGIEPLLQALSRSPLLESMRGPRGGYRLGRARRSIRLSEIVEVALADEGAVEDGPGGELFSRVLEPFWTGLDRTVAEQLGARTLDDLICAAERAGLQRPLAEPISFSI